MPKKLQKTRSKLATIVGSRAFFWVIIGLFVCEAAWIALSSRYPMAFDEGTHLGMLKLYSHQWGPLILQQPDGPAPFSQLTHNPSYLYYWLMSFPYRWLSSIFDLHATVIVLRFMNIAFFAGGLAIFRQILLRTRASAAIVHAVLLFFVLIPIATLQAGQINYDNLLFLLLGWNLLQVLRFREQLLKKKTCNIPLLLGTLVVGMLASLVQYSYTPFLAAIVAYLVFFLWTQRRHVRKLTVKNWHATTKLQKYSALAVFVIALGLFVEMYGVNFVRYHNIIPQCNQVLSVERCRAFGPWARNYDYAQHPLPHANHNPLVYTGGWISGMMQRSFFVINGPTGPSPYANKFPLPVLFIGASVIFLAGIVLIARHWRQVLTNDPVLCILLFTSLVYVASLWGRLYYDYVQLDRLVAVNGRYLLMMILPVLTAMSIAFRYALSRHWQMWLAGATMVIFLQGGGFLSFIYFSNADWYWPHDRTVLRVNQAAQKIVRPLTINWP